MKQRPRGARISGPPFFWIGVLLELCLSAAVLWGELEASLYAGHAGSLPLDLHCPIMLSRNEGGTISASVTNTIEKDTSPVIAADISRLGGDRQVSQTLAIALGETQSIQWKVDASDIIFGRLILVDITQGRYLDLPSRESTCGIFILSIPGLTGAESFALLSGLAVALISFGVASWLKTRLPLDDAARSFASAHVLLAACTTAGLLAAVPRWWGVILFADSVAPIIMVVIFTEFVLFGGHKANR